MVQCIGINKSGARCKLNAKDCTLYCKRHTKPLEVVEVSDISEEVFERPVKSAEDILRKYRKKNRLMNTFKRLYLLPNFPRHRIISLPWLNYIDGKRYGTYSNKFSQLFSAMLKLEKFRDGRKIIYAEYQVIDKASKVGSKDVKTIAAVDSEGCLWFIGNTFNLFPNNPTVITAKQAEKFTPDRELSLIIKDTAKNLKKLSSKTVKDLREKIPRVSLVDSEEKSDVSEKLTKLIDDKKFLYTAIFDPKEKSPIEAAMLGMNSGGIYVVTKNFKVFVAGYKELYALSGDSRLGFNQIIVPPIKHVTCGKRIVGLVTVRNELYTMMDGRQDQTNPIYIANNIEKAIALKTHSTGILFLTRNFRLHLVGSDYLKGDSTPVKVLEYYSLGDVYDFAVTKQSVVFITVIGGKNVLAESHFRQRDSHAREVKIVNLDGIPLEVYASRDKYQVFIFADTPSGKKWFVYGKNKFWSLGKTNEEKIPEPVEL